MVSRQILPKIWRWLTKKPLAEEVASLSMSISEKMKLRCQGIFCITKGGNSPEECEDAYECSSLNSQSPWYFAVSDGATESSFSKEWASKLVKSFVNEAFDSPEEISDWLEPLQQKWSNWLSQKDLPWFAKRKAAQGAYATLLGLKIEPNTSDQEFKWQSIAVGDSCLFVVHSESLLSCFPLGQSSDLNSTPDLVGTLPESNNTLTKSVKVTRGNAQSETHFYLVTDALAGWIFKTLESEKNPWQILDSINTQEEFIGWLDDLRVSREIRNDDTTMIHLYLD
jgi:hypothetical protein